MDEHSDPVGQPGVMADADPAERAVRPLDDAGNPILETVTETGSRRGRLIAGAVVALVAVLALGGVLAWRNLVGSPHGAAEAVPADADMVFTFDFLQMRDTERFDRLVRAFATPMAEHGLIDEAPDFEGMLREFDDEAEQELGFRFAEDVFSWMGRSGSLAMWFPRAMFDFDAVDSDALPSVLATLQVRDEAAAAAFLDRLLVKAAEDGDEFEQIQVGGKPAYYFPDETDEFYITLRDGRFLLADSLTLLRRAVETDASESVAELTDFQALSSTLGGEPLMTAYVSPSLGEELAASYERLGIDFPYAEELARTSAMMTVELDDAGFLVRTANAVPDNYPIGPGAWGPTLPEGTYGFVDVALPAGYFAEMASFYEDTVASAGLTEADIAALIEPVDQVIGMSLLDDLVPALGGEILLAVAPARDGVIPLEAGIDLGVLLGIGVDDSALVAQALDNALRELENQGITVRDRNGTRVIAVDGVDYGALAVTNDAFAASSSPELLETFVAESGSLGATPTYQRVDSSVAGDGLAVYVDITRILGDFVDDATISDVLSPLAAAGGSYTVENGFQLSEFRLLIDY